MIITDFNEMSIQELNAINAVLSMEFEINDGKIVGTALQNGKQGD